MGNTPSQAQGSPSRSTEHGGIYHAGSASGSGSNNNNGGGSKEGTPSSTIKSNSRHPSMRLPMPSRPSHISPNSSHPTSPSGRGGSPRRRKSLELPDLNKLSFTPAAVVATTATTTSHATHARHGDTLSPSSVPTQSSAGVIPGAAGGGGGGARKWQHVLGGRTASPLSGSLGPMSKVQALPASVPEPRSMPIPGTGGMASPRGGNVNPYFPSSPQKSTGSSTRRASVAPIPIPISGRPANANVDSHGASPPPNTVAPTPGGGGGGGRVDEQGDGLVAVPINWQGTAKTVYVTGSFADNWKGRIKLNRSTHDFNTILRLPPGTYQLKFIVDDSWRCSKQIPTATDDDGTLVNWIEVEASKTEEEIKAEWAMDSKPAVKTEVDDESQWTNIIPAPLVAYQYIEELPSLLNQGEWDNFTHVCQYMSPIPQPPALPRILDRVIVNPEPKRRSDNTGMGIMSPAGLDDNSILAVPNHVVLNHLTASAIKNGTLGVGTTTRYRKKYITTMFFKPTLQDLMDGNTAPPPGPGQPEDLGQPVPS